MDDTFTLFADIAAEVEIPEDGVLSRPVFNSDRLRVVLFGLSAGQELTEHTTSMEAVLHFLKGEADLILGDSQQSVKAGAWIRMAPRLPHSLKAKTPVLMLLLLVKDKS